MDIIIRYQQQDFNFHFSSQNPAIKDLNSEVHKLTKLPIKQIKYIFHGKSIMNPKYKFDEIGIKPNSKILVYGTQAVKTNKRAMKKKTPSKINVNLQEAPHLNIIQKGPPDGCIPSSKGQLNSLPKEPLIVYDTNGNIAKFRVEQDGALWIEYSNTESERIFFSYINNAIIKDIPGYEDQYFAFSISTQIGNRNFYFIPNQYHKLFDELFAQL